MVEGGATLHGALFDAGLVDRVVAYVAPGLPRVLCDKAAMVDALVNLLSNAYKYGGQPRRIEIGASANEREVSITVRDNGSPDRRHVMSKSKSSCRFSYWAASTVRTRAVIPRRSRFFAKGSAIRSQVGSSSQGRSLNASESQAPTRPGRGPSAAPAINPCRRSSTSAVIARAPACPRGNASCATGSPMTITYTGGPTGGAYQLGASSASCCAQATLSSSLSPFRADRSFTLSVWANLGDTVPATGFAS